MKQNRVEVLIITRSVALQEGLGALLESLPGVTHVKAIKDLANAYAWVESHQPELALLDVALSGGDSQVLERIQILSPTTQRILLVDQVQDVQWVPQFAEAVLIKGIAPGAVATIVNNLLSTKGDKDEHHDSSEGKQDQSTP
jgi:DNA-binding NarL/FixJ family response regulator